MRHALSAAVLVLATWLSGAAEPPAPPVPDTAALIEALTPRATRGLRNLQVRERVDGAASAAAAGPAAAVPAPAPATPPAPPAAPYTPVSPPAGPAPGQPPGATTPAVDDARPSIALAIPFELNSARLRPESGPLLGNLVAAMQSPALKGSRFVIEGHTDASGPQALNQRLSQERAEEVRLYLVALGVHPARLRAVGRGASEPANPAAPQAPENRRVRVVTIE